MREENVLRDNHGIRNDSFGELDHLLVVRGAEQQTLAVGVVALDFAANKQISLRLPTICVLGV